MLLYAPLKIEITSTAFLAGGVGGFTVGACENPNAVIRKKIENVIFFMLMMLYISSLTKRWMD